MGLTRENIESRRLSTPAVLTFANTCCPVILEPKFLRYNKILNEHFGVRETCQDQKPGAAYLEEWQEFKRTLNQITKIEKKAKLKKLNNLFNKESVSSYHPDWRTYCKN